MMHTTELQELRAKVERQKYLQRTAEQLREQQQTLRRRLDDLRALYDAEAQDVAALERISLASLFYAVIGQKAERLDKERREEYAARMKCDVAQRELDAVTAELEGINREIISLGGCANRYEVLLQQRRQQLRADEGAAGERMRELEETLAVTEHRQRELLEAIAAGERALSLTDGVLARLHEARSLGKWDMFGGGMLVNLEKHEYLDSAQGQLALLQEELNRFRRESLDIDVQVHADVEVNIEGFDRFADVFLDNIFHDLTVQDSIEHSLSQVNTIRDRIEPILHTLRDMRSDNERALQQVQKQLQDHLTDCGLQ